MKPSSWTNNAAFIENEVIMHRRTHRGSFLILEGEDDSRFWDRRVSQECELVIGDGKPNVEGAIVRLDERNFSGTLGIVDADFDRLQGRALPSPNLLATDAHDLECMLLRSAALERVLAEYGDRDKIRRFQDIHDCTVRDALLERGLVFGRLCWLSKRRGWNLPFARLGPERFTDRSTWEVDRDGLYKAAVTAIDQQNLGTIREAISELPDADPWSICRGHDLTGLLRIGLQQVLGDLKPSKGVADVAALLRAAFDKNDLYRGAFCRSIRGWESANPPYQVLPPPVP